MSDDDRSPGTLGTPPCADVVAASRACQQADLTREGIAMFVALHDARPGACEDLAPTRDQEAERLAELFDHYHHALADAGFPQANPDPEPDETGAPELIDVLVVLSDRHLHAPDPSAGPDGPDGTDE